MNKKKAIILSAVVLLIVVIAIICIVVFTGENKENNETTTTTQQNEVESNDEIKETESTSEEKETESTTEEVESTSEIETESTSEVETTTEEVKTEEPTTKKPTTGNNQQQTLDIKEAYKLTPVGSYTEVEMELDDALKEVLQNTRVVRRTYENGAVRDYMIIDGEEVILDSPYGVVSDDYVADPNAGAHVSSGEKPTQPQKQEVVYKGIVPPRSNYSSDEEWKTVVNDISNQDSNYNYTYFSSEADAQLYAQLCYGGEYTGDTSFINMTTEEWLKWCEENGFSVN